MSLGAYPRVLSSAPALPSLSGDVDGPASSTDNAAARWDGTTGKLLQDSVLIISDNGDVTQPSTATNGLQLYNTVDQVTNYERLETIWTGNVATIRTVRGGTGILRPIVIGPDAQSRSFITINPTGTDPYIGMNFSGSGIATGNTYFSVSNAAANGATSGTVKFVGITPTYNQSASTAANTDLLINRMQTAVGSGAQLLIDAQVGAVSKFKVDNTGLGTFTSSAVNTENWTRILNGSVRGAAFGVNAANNVEIQTFDGGSWGTRLTISNTTNTISGAGANMILIAGTGNSRTMALQSTTSGGAATTFLTGDAVQNVTLGNGLINPTGTSANSGNGMVQRFRNGYATAAQTPAAATRTYITGSDIGPFTAAQLQVGTFIHWHLDITKTAAGTAAATFDIAFGTAGSTADTARVSFTKPAGTAQVDHATVDIWAQVKTNSASGVVVGDFSMMVDQTSVTLGGFLAAAKWVSSLTTTSGTFDTTTPTHVGLCVTTGASDAWTINQCQAWTANL